MQSAFIRVEPTKSRCVRQEGLSCVYCDITGKRTAITELVVVSTWTYTGRTKPFCLCLLHNRSAAAQDLLQVNPVSCVKRVSPSRRGGKGGGGLIMGESVLATVPCSRESEAERDRALVNGP